MRAVKVPVGLVYRNPDRPSLHQEALADPARPPIAADLTIDGRYEELQELFV